MISRTTSTRRVEPVEDAERDEVPYEASWGILRLGATVREQRQRKSMALAELADASGLSIGLLSRLENGIGNPSLATLTRLSAALGIHIAELFNYPADSYYDKASPDEPIEMTVPRIGVRHALLQATLNLRFVVSLVTLSPNEDAPRPHQHRGTKFVSVLRGRVTLSVDDERYLLRHGDSATYDASRTHSREPQGRGEASLLNVAPPPTAPAMAGGPKSTRRPDVGSSNPDNACHQRALREGERSSSPSTRTPTSPAT